MPGYRVQEYTLVLSPHEDLRQRIAGLREDFSSKFQHPSSKQLKPYISLVRFSTWEMMEEKITQSLQIIAMGMMPFKVELKDFGSLPSHTLFINVVSRVPVLHLVKELKQAQRIMKMKAGDKPHFMEDPYIPLAVRLKPWQYEQSWADYSNRQFTARFIADHMLLLKKSTGHAWQIVRRFEFQNLPVTTRQGSLFNQ